MVEEKNNALATSMGLSQLEYFEMRDQLEPKLGPKARVVAGQEPLPEDFGVTEQELRDYRERAAKSRKTNEKASEYLFAIVGYGLMFFIVFWACSGMARTEDQPISFGSCLAVPIAAAIFLWLANTFILADPKPPQPISQYTQAHNEWYEKYVEALNDLIRGEAEYWKSLSPRQFELQIAQVFELRGFEVRVTPGSADQGFDIQLNKEGATTLVECKRWQDPVGPAVARQLYGVMTSLGADHGIIVCPAGGTRGAKEFIRGKPMKIFEIAQILSLAGANRPNQTFWS